MRKDCVLDLDMKDLAVGVEDFNTNENYAYNKWKRKTTTSIMMISK